MPDPLLPLSDLISIDLLPEELHIPDLTSGFLADIQYKNHVVTNKSASGHEATHNLTLVFTKTISFTFPGLEVKLLLNPAVNGSVTTTEIPLQVHYVWNIIKFISDFNIQSIPSDLDTLLTTLTNIYDIDYESVIDKLISYYEEAADTITIPVQAIIDELNRFYNLAGTANELSFSGVPTFDEIKDSLLANAGKTLDDIISDFNLGSVVSDPSSASEVLGAVIKKGIYKLVESLNQKYGLTGSDRIEYDLHLDFNAVGTKLSSLGHSAVDLIKDLVIDVSSNFNTLKEELFHFLNIHIPDMPSSFEELFVPQVEAHVTNVDLAFEFPRSMLIPLDDQNHFLQEPATSKLTFHVGNFSFTTESGFDFDEVLTCELQRSSVLETGITIDFDSCVLDIHDDTNIPQANSDGRPLTFKGIFIDEATVTLPAIWQTDDTQSTTAVIKGRNLLIGDPGGFTGHLVMETDPAHPGDLLHFELPGLFKVQLENFDLQFNKNSLDTTNINGKLIIEGLKKAGTDEDAQVDIAVTISDDTYSFTFDNIPAFDLAGIKLDLGTILFSLNTSGIKEFSADGTLCFPMVDNGSGSPQAIGINLTKDNDNYKISVSGSPVPSLYLGGLEIKLTKLTIGFNKDGIIESDTEISGTIKIDAFDIELNIDITFEENGFAITAKIPEGTDYINVVDIEDLINVQLSMLSIGKHGSKWSFGFGGKIVNHIVIPGIEKFVPKDIDIKKFDLSETDNIDIDIDLSWPNGFNIKNIGQGGSATVPVDMSFGDVMSIRAIQIDLKTGDPTEIDALLLGTKFSLGPVTCTIEGMGLGAKIELKDSGGNLGPVDVSLRVIYPKGIGISLESDIFTGGGYLFFDSDNNRYAGALELSIQDMFSFTAIGLLTTVLPDGSKGTSLLIIITTEFPAPIPLSYNFYLSGVGGLIGLHRTVNADKLGSGVNTGSISNILFPKNVISNISQIISDLRAIFPPKRDQFLIGPMAMITWNTPPLLTIELGVMIEFDDPVRIFILGVIRTAIPTKEHALIKINVAFIGVIDFNKGMISFDAGLFDSRIVTFTLEGQMALRLSWGASPDFAVAVGGFHPAYKPAPHLHFFEMKRLTINFLSGNPRLTLTSYFALTTNSVQFGAAIDFYLKVAMFKIVGGFGFDVLFIFDPFRFIAQVSAGLAVKCGGSTLFSISLSFTLTGPNPWVASGKASFRILFIKYTAKFSKTIGEEKKITLPDVNVLPLVIKALNDSNNWKSELPVDHFDLITLRKDIDLAEGEVLMAAFGTLTVSQKIVPLGISIERFGNNNPTGDKLFEISDIRLYNSSGTTPLDTETAREDFVPAAYKEMSDDDKLSAPSFEKLKGGFKTTGTDEPETQWGINKNVEYEVIISDTERMNDNPDRGLTSYGIHQSDLLTIPAELFTHFAKGGAVSNSVLSGKNRVRTFNNPKKVTLGTEHFVIARKNDLKVFDSVTFQQGSRAEANEAFLNAATADPSLKDELIIIPDYKAVLQD